MCFFPLEVLCVSRQEVFMTILSDWSIMFRVVVQSHLGFQDIQKIVDVSNCMIKAWDIYEYCNLVVV